MNFIYFLPFGDIALEMLDFARETVEFTFDCNCSILENQDIPKQTYDAGRNQYSCTGILREVLRLCPENAKRIIGITTVDLFVPVLTFVFGQAQLDGKAALVSAHRLRQEYYALPANSGVLVHRLSKEILHELGHTFGMTHCHNPACVMHFSYSVREIDIKENRFCAGCTRILEDKL